jgi:hypothetical protein
LLTTLEKCLCFVSRLLLVLSLLLRFCILDNIGVKEQRQWAKARGSMVQVTDTSTVPTGSSTVRSWNYCTWYGKVLGKGTTERLLYCSLTTSLPSLKRGKREWSVRCQVSGVRVQVGEWWCDWVMHWWLGAGDWLCCKNDGLRISPHKVWYPCFIAYSFDQTRNQTSNHFACTVAIILKNWRAGAKTPE